MIGMVGSAAAKLGAARAATETMALAKSSFFNILVLPRSALEALDDTLGPRARFKVTC